MSARIRQSQLPVMEVRGVDGHTADALLDDWAHPLGGCRRPFGREDWLLEIDGAPAALATSASTVSPTVRVFDDVFARDQVVELARVARAPTHPRIMRVMVRLWVEYLAARWPYWTPRIAVSYGMPGRRGDIYRFDGWINAGPRRPSGGGGSWSAPPVVNRHADGVKTLWVAPLTEDVPLSRDAATATATLP